MDFDYTDYELGLTRDKPTPALRVKEPWEVV
jgi:hypothetical protein